MMSIALAQKNETFQIVLRYVIRQHLFPQVKFIKKYRFDVQQEQEVDLWSNLRKNEPYMPFDRRKSNLMDE